jgi:hypothetical protein
MFTDKEEALLEALKDEQKLAEIIAVLQYHQLLPAPQETHCDML